MTETNKKLQEKLQEIRNPQKGKFNYLRRRQEEQQEQKYLQEELEKIKRNID